MAEEYISFLKISYGFYILTPTPTLMLSRTAVKKEKKGNLLANQNPTRQWFFYARKPPLKTDYKTVHFSQRS